ncbi:MAG: hypothetical protein UV61_C0018G0008 [Candidatus Gottesmanbacteria bacterium GW2011_GWB1_43_11]|uniref:Uncharacterized protein n=1 Tax=Candidatus Gottesmanbacteria bacterium GW2011_GWB1_43_11 TaxID=1618446 RepID=A0A0G1CIQ6_9BACT|nr:MAG: hypothetical protein UV04_C0019G0008 [Candidatus Gottesmanbacteria bacterium GW2011_GWA2_42_16]KKS54314.1 MAG: hypothetical protein UV17_C0021G0008 [Candidatus Gottesmanbacteria bacterium GW2011_GWA1_42_26]KKS80945.1 MAG: hypothetical protein UV55_C0025G0008 [Candidatus Gottesmanbacteria bacterium GW2011_GWC1_43_10]KKS85369.1 MAG: hypothetical protein UV61_C0018G0008 [Candidatus Gottesmanbacteria bacterium GW2011_GWB1_43_11]OGG08534.1 MAG: hypothetical protein A2699_03360 [Candidatus Go
MRGLRNLSLEMRLKLLSVIKSRIDLHLVLILLFGTTVLLIFKDSLFTPTSNFIDPWLYFGYFLNLPKYLRVFTGTYYGARLGWLLPGFAAYRLFPPLLANYTLRLLIYFPSLISSYLILKQVFRKPTALLTTLLLASNIWFLRAVSWDYVDGIGITYLFLSLLALIKAVHSNHQMSWLILTGGLFALIIFTNIFLVAFIPLLIIYFFYLNLHSKKGNVIISLKYIFVGSVTTTLILCLISLKLGGSFFFFKTTLSWITNYFGQVSPWQKSGYHWLLTAGWLMFPMVTFVSSIWFLLKERLDINKKSAALFFPVLFICVFILYVIIDLHQSMALLQTFYYTSFFVPFMYLAWATILFRASTNINHSQFYGLTMMAISTQIITLIIYQAFPLLNIQFSPYLPILILTSGLAGFMGLWSRLTSSKRLFFWLVFISLTNLISGFSLRELWQTKDQNWRNNFLTVYESTQTISSINPRLDTFFWYGRERQTGVYVAISSTYLWQYRLIDDDFPKVAQAQNLKKDTKIVILSETTDVYEAAAAVLTKLGHGTRLVRQESINRDKVNLVMTFIQLTD